MARLWQATYLRYVGASGVALGVDMALFLLLTTIHVPAAVAAATGYCAGIAVHWLISSRLVFTDARAAESDRRRQALFVASALVGLGVTVGIVGLGALLAVHPVVAKLIAIAVSFQLTYVLRSRIVFA